MAFNRKNEALKKMERYKELTKTLEEMQRYLHKTLLKDSGQQTELERHNIILRMKDLKEKRKMLLQEVLDIYKKEIKMAGNNKKNLNVSNRITDILRLEIKNTNKNINKLKSEKHNKSRLAKIGDWEYKRYKSHTDIFKYLLTCILVVSLVYSIYTLPIIDRFKFIIEPFAILIIVSTILYTLYTISGLIYWNARRDNIDWDIYDQGDTSSYDNNFNTGTGNSKSLDFNDLLKQSVCDGNGVSGRVNVNVEEFVSDINKDNEYYYIN